MSPSKLNEKEAFGTVYVAFHHGKGGDETRDALKIAGDPALPLTEAERLAFIETATAKEIKIQISGDLKTAIPDDYGHARFKEGQHDVIALTRRTPDGTKGHGKGNRQGCREWVISSAAAFPEKSQPRVGGYRPFSATLIGNDGEEILIRIPGVEKLVTRQRDTRGVRHIFEKTPYLAGRTLSVTVRTDTGTNTVEGREHQVSTIVVSPDEPDLAPKGLYATVCPMALDHGHLLLLLNKDGFGNECSEGKFALRNSPCTLYPLIERALTANTFEAQAVLGPDFLFIENAIPSDPPPAKDVAADIIPPSRVSAASEPDRTVSSDEASSRGDISVSRLRERVRELGEEIAAQAISGQTTGIREKADQIDILNREIDLRSGFDEASVKIAEILEIRGILDLSPEQIAAILRKFARMTPDARKASYEKAVAEDHSLISQMVA